MEWLAGFSITDIGAGALVVIFVLMIMLGKLVPKSTVDASTLNWERAYNNSQETVRAQAQQMDTLLSSLKTLEQVITALRIEAQRTRDAESSEK